MVMSIFAFSPDKNNGDKTKAENLIPPSPPSSWQLNIVVTDPYDSCAAYNGNGTGCNLEFFLQPATSNCVGVLAYPSTSIPIVWGTKSYSAAIPDTIPCVEVSIIPVPPSTCSYKYNKIPCCSCIGNSTCYFNICQ